MFDSGAASLVDASRYPGRARVWLCLGVVFIVALIPRLYSAQTMGWDWDYPGSFTLVNFDEGGSCRAALKGFDYSTFIGRQTIAITEALGQQVSPGMEGNYQGAKGYCHSTLHIQVARFYSAIVGSLTVVLIAVMGLVLMPSRPQVAWTAAGILALSGFHVSESHVGTVDAASVFFIYAFLTWMVFTVKRKSLALWLIGVPLLIFAIWTKYWVFAVAAYVVLVPARAWEYMSTGLSFWRICMLGLASVVMFALASNADFQHAGLYPLLLVFYLLVPWRAVTRPTMLLLGLMPFIAFGLAQVDLVREYSTGAPPYAPIGWNKWLRNPLNTVTVLVVGLGLPACLFIPSGIKAIVNDRANVRGWLCLSPILLFLAFMMFIASVTYYRHYLALIPAAALVAALGLWSTPWARRPWFMVLFFVWPALLMVDIELDYHRDPRIALRGWYQQHSEDRVFYSYYVNPPPHAASSWRLFQPEFAFGEAVQLRQAQYLILSENWYDTAFANELNGPYVGNTSRLIKTSPQYSGFYRDALADRHPYLRLERSIALDNFMPELIVHKWFYGTFQMFVGDIKVLRVVP